MTLMPILVGLFVATAIALLIWSFYSDRKRRKELAAWAASKGFTFTEQKSHEMQNILPGFPCLRQGNNRYAFNIMEGTYAARPFTGFDYHYETTSTDSKGRTHTTDHYFSAITMRAEVSLKPLLIRPEGFFDKVAGFLGFDDIDFESAEFSRKFYVKAPDRKWAYDVIHTRAMEFLLAMPQFKIQFDADRALAWRDYRIATQDFEVAAELVCGLLDRLPEYVIRQQREQADMRGT